MAQEVTSTPESTTEPKPFYGIRSYLHLLYERGSQDIDEDGEDGEDNEEEGYSFVQPRDPSVHRRKNETCFRIALICSLFGLIIGSILAAGGFIISPPPSSSSSSSIITTATSTSSSNVSNEKGHRPLDEAVDSFVHSKISMGGLIVLGVSAFILSCSLLLPVIASTHCGHYCQNWYFKVTGRSDEDAAQLILPSNRKNNKKKRSFGRIPVNQSFESIQPSRQTDQDS